MLGSQRLSAKSTSIAVQVGLEGSVHSCGLAGSRLPAGVVAIHHPGFPPPNAQVHAKGYGELVVVYVDHILQVELCVDRGGQLRQRHFVVVAPQADGAGTVAGLSCSAHCPAPPSPARLVRF